MNRIFQIVLILLMTSKVFADNSVGSPKGMLDVNSTGAAVYQLSFELPNGGTFSPQLGIAYNSQAGYGQAGYGFSITGLSAITRGNKNIYYDREITATDYISESSYYFDGKRLILKSGEDGVNGAIYTPEGDPYTEITLHGSMSNVSSTWFDVKVDDGVTYQYGNRTNARLLFTSQNTNRCAAWYVNKATDRYGNTIDYYYTINNLCVLPDHVTYGSNTAQSRGITCRVDFAYSNIASSNVRTFKILSAQGSFAKKLSEVTCSMNNQTYRRYVLEYNETSDSSWGRFSRLKKVTEYNGNGDSYPPIQIDWNYLQAPNIACSSKDIIAVHSDQYRTEYINSFVSCDLNGDGLSDIIELSSISGMGEGLYAYVNLAEKDQYGNTRFTGHRYTNCLISDFLNFADTKFQANGLTFADIDGDGINDFLMQIYDNTFWEGSYRPIYFHYILGKDVKSGYYTSAGVMQENLHSENSESPSFVTLDMNGDGKDEILFIEDNNISDIYYGKILSLNADGRHIPTELQFSFSSTPKKLFLGDYNGDGLQDLIMLCESGYKIYNNNGYHGSLQNVFTENNTTQGTNLTDCWRVNQGDFNGDGLIDFLCNSQGQECFYIAFNQGNGNFNISQTSNLGFSDHATNQDDDEFSVSVLDINNDGRSDIVVSKAKYVHHGFPLFKNSYDDRTDIKILVSNGSTLVPFTSFVSNREDDAKEAYIFTGDFDGDGTLELANYGYRLNDNSSSFAENAIHIYKFGSQASSSGKVSAITDGYGAKTYITYSSATNPSVYTAGQSAYPVNSYTLPLSVVSGLRVSGTGIPSRSFNYSYGDFRVHVGGKGALGFSSMTKTDNALCTTERTYVDSWNTTYWTPSRTVQTRTIGNNTETTVSTYNIYSDNAHHNCYSYIASSSTTDFDGNVTNSYNSIYDYQQGSHPAYQVVSYDSNDTFKEIQYPLYTNVCGMYLPASKITGQQYLNEEYVSSTTRYVYDHKGNPTLVSENDGTDHNLQKSYTYDVYGNVLSETVSGNGITPMTKYYEYDSTGRFVTRTYTIPSSVEMTYTYDLWGNLLTETDATNTSGQLTTNYTYDGWGRKTGASLPDGNSVSYSYVWDSSVSSACYRVTEWSTTNPVAKTYYDAMGRERLTSTTGLRDVQITNSTTYNNKGQVVQKNNTEGNKQVTETFTYDNRGRVVSDSFSTGQQTTYSYGNRTMTTTSAGRSTTKNYDVWGNVISITDPVSSVSYTYNSFGKPKEITSGSSTVELTYDEVGNRVAIDDPNAGYIQYAYDAAGRLMEQTDARGVRTEIVYDAQGRIQNKNVGNETITYTYGTSGNAKNRLASISSSVGTITYSYDVYGNVLSKTRSMVGEAPMTFQYTYDSGRLDTQTYPDGFVAVNKYMNGILWSMSKADRSSSLWGYNLYDGTNTMICYGGETYNFLPFELFSHVEPGPIEPGDPLDPIDPVDPIDPDDPEIPDTPDPPFSRNVVFNFNIDYTSVCNNLGMPLSQQIFHNESLLAENGYVYSYYDGNLISRTLHGKPTESFAYDDADRLISSSMFGTTTMSISYSPNGNIISKTGIGNYDYQSSKPHAVTSVDNTNGLISDTPQSITYNDFGKVSRIEEGDYVLEITYGPDEERWKSVLYHNNNVVRTTTYFDDYESVTENGITSNWHDLGNGALYLTDSNGNEMELVAFTDHQGSILKLIDLEGNVKFDASYDVWGRQTINLNFLRYYHGYTGHEMIPELALVNMNGRFYDPLLARFLSPDNYVQAPDNSQNFNRYSYCLNNPLRYTDPSGEIFWLIPAAIIVGSGAMNAIMNADNIHNFGQAFSYFCIGGLSGTVALMGGPVGMFASGALLGGGNSFLTQGITKGFGNVDWPGVANSALFAGATSCLSSAFGNYVSSVTGGWLNRIKDVTLRETLNGVVGGGITGAAMGAISDFNGAEGSFWENVGKGFGFGILEGGLGGFAKGRILQIQKKTELHRPYIREGVRKAVEETADRLPDGRFLDVNTGCPINGKYDLGHKPFFEYRRMKKWAESIGMSQKQFNDFMNNPYFYQIELPKLNRSHIFEYKGPTNINYFDYLR